MGFSEFVLERWYGKKSWGVLYPVARASEIFYSAGIALHRHRFSPKRGNQVKLPVKVISVGNITVGGTGKTSFVIYLAKKLLQFGLSPAVLVRGYFSKVKKYARLDNKSTYFDPSVFGDEPVMMAQVLDGIPVWVGRDRTATGQLAIESGSNVLILDDGFQYMRLARDVNIVCFNAQAGIGNGSLILRGPLREPLDSLKRADAIACIGDGEKVGGISSIAQKFGLPRPIRAHYEIEGLKNTKTGDIVSLDGCNFVKVAAFCAIAVPYGFFKTLEDSGFEILLRRIFRDHHRYSKAEIEKIALEAESLNAQALVTTRKDGVKIDKKWLDDVKLDLWELVVSLKVEREEELLKWLTERLK